MTEASIREAICRFGRSLFERGLSRGSSGNISVRLDDGCLICTPTNASLGFLDPASLVHVDAGRAVSGGKPTKELPLHEALYATRPTARAVVHLHSTYSVAVSTLPGLDPGDVLPPLTPYYVMRVGRTALVPYFRPGDPAVGDAVRDLGGRFRAVLLSNHGPVVAGETLDAAVWVMEELEETARLFLLLRGMQPRALTHEQVQELLDSR